MARESNLHVRMLNVRDNARGVHRKFLETGERRYLQTLQKSISPGLYEHWHTTEDDPFFYLLTGIAFFGLAIDEPVAECVRLCGALAGERCLIPLFEGRDALFGSIEHNGVITPQFASRQKLSKTEVQVLIKNIEELQNASNTANFLSAVAMFLKQAQKQVF